MPTDYVTEMRRELDQQLLDHYLAMDENGSFVNPPSTDEELHEFIQVAIGVRFPRKVLTEGHRTAFDFVADLFFERVKTALGFANRTGGKTYAVAVLNILDMIFKPQCDIASAGADRRQAERCYEYLLEFMELPFFKQIQKQYAILTGNSFLVKEPTKRETLFANGSKLEIITGNEKGFRGPHPNKVRIDEIDEIPWNILQTGLSMSHTSNGVKGQDVFTSTRQRMDGSMQRMINEAKERGVVIYEWNVWEMIAKCDRRCVNDSEHGTCPILKRCQGKAHSCDGFYEIEDFIDKTRKIDTENYETEWLNLRPARHKMVYSGFSVARHVLSSERFRALAGRDEPSWEWEWISSIDFGSSPGHPFVYSKYVRLPSTSIWVLWFEYIAAEQRLLRDHAQSIASSPFYSPSHFIYADHDAQDRIELKQYGIRTRKAKKGAGSVNVGIDYIKGLLSGLPPDDRPLLYFMDWCDQHIKEYQLYEWPTKLDGTPDRSGRPKQENDHTCDSDRYALFTHNKKRSSRFRSESIAGV